ncbi:MAG: (2Fe-2S)-binding protein [Alphaproteobacteria bacterium]|nr:(2Fe-2S)-binding protein [Alphaproteobacteria bacterium]
MMKLTVNGAVHELDVEDEMPLLWALREELGLRGTKFGCGMGLCGACTVHVDGQAQRACVTPVSMAAGKSVRTIEDLGSAEDPHPIQREWLSHAVPQCGYCQPGMQMAAVAFLEKRAAEAEDPDAPLPPPTDEEVRRAITNICRCGCYERIRQAVVKAGTLG